MTDLLDLAAEADARRAMAEALTDARALRDEAFAQLDDADRDGWDTRVIDAAIGHLAESGSEFSANHLRDLLPDVKQPLIGRRVNSWSARKLIKVVRYEPSTLPSTHYHRIAVWTGANKNGATP